MIPLFPRNGAFSFVWFGQNFSLDLPLLLFIFKLLLFLGFGTGQLYSILYFVSQEEGKILELILIKKKSLGHLGNLIWLSVVSLWLCVTCYLFEWVAVLFLKKKKIWLAKIGGKEERMQREKRQMKPSWLERNIWSIE